MPIPIARFCIDWLESYQFQLAHRAIDVRGVPVNAAASLAERKFFMRGINKRRHAPGNYFAPDLFEQFVAIRTARESETARIEGMACKYFANLLAEQLALDIKNVRSGAQSLVPGEHYAILGASQMQGLRARKRVLAEHVRAHQPKPSGKPLKHPIRGKFWRCPTFFHHNAYSIAGLYDGGVRSENEAAMKEQSATFSSGDLTLEGLLALPASTATACGVVCHPHPLYGGSMYNNVVDAVLEAMWRMEWATLRFNFRGVGRSEGEHDAGRGESADAAAAVRFLASRASVRPDRMVLAGYSFGAVAALSAATQVGELSAILLVALPTRMAGTSALRELRMPILLAAGDDDTYCPAVELETVHKDLHEGSQIRIISGADHFFGGHEEQLTEAVEAMLKAV
jgi:alpha/beta superfamily hydrolase